MLVRFLLRRIHFNRRFYNLVFQNFFIGPTNFTRLRTSRQFLGVSLSPCSYGELQVMTTFWSIGRSRQHTLGLRRKPGRCMLLAAQMPRQHHQGKHVTTTDSSSALSGGSVSSETDACPSLQMKAGIAASLACLLASIAAATPATAAADLKLGEQVFEKNCASCHAGGGNRIPGEEARALNKEALSQYTDGQFNEEAIVELGWHFLSGLSTEEIDAVASYVFRQAALELWKQ